MALDAAFCIDIGDSALEPLDSGLAEVRIGAGQAEYGGNLKITRRMVDLGDRSREHGDEEQRAREAFLDHRSFPTNILPEACTIAPAFWALT